MIFMKELKKNDGYKVTIKPKIGIESLFYGVI